MSQGRKCRLRHRNAEARLRCSRPRCGRSGAGCPGYCSTAHRPLHEHPKLRRHLSVGRPRPLHRQKSIRHERLTFPRNVDHHRDKKRRSLRDRPRAFPGEKPLKSKAAFSPPLRGGRNHPQQRAIADLAPALRVPRIAADEFVFVEPHFGPAVRNASAR